MSSVFVKIKSKEFLTYSLRRLRSPENALVSISAMLLCCNFLRENWENGRSSIYCSRQVPPHSDRFLFSKLSPSNHFFCWPSLPLPPRETRKQRQQKQENSANHSSHSASSGGLGPGGPWRTLEGPGPWRALEDHCSVFFPAMPNNTSLLFFFAGQLLIFAAQMLGNCWALLGKIPSNGPPGPSPPLLALWLLWLALFSCVYCLCFLVSAASAGAVASNGPPGSSRAKPSTAGAVFLSL